MTFPGSTPIVPPHTAQQFITQPLIMAQSLAEHLGVVDIKHPEVPVSNPAVKLTAKQFCEAVVESPEFRSYITNGVTMQDLPVPLLLRIMDHAWGKPVEQVEVKDTTNRLEAWTPQQLEERALFLAETARRLRQEQAVTPEAVH